MASRSSTPKYTSKKSGAEIDHELGQAVGRVRSLEHRRKVVETGMCIRLRTRIHYIAVLVKWSRNPTKGKLVITVIGRKPELDLSKTWY